MVTVNHKIKLMRHNLHNMMRLLPQGLPVVQCPQVHQLPVDERSVPMLAKLTNSGLVPIQHWVDNSKAEDSTEAFHNSSMMQDILKEDTSKLQLQRNTFHRMDSKKAQELEGTNPRRHHIPLPVYLQP
jgi:hypothetical protein